MKIKKIIIMFLGILMVVLSFLLLEFFESVGWQTYNSIEWIDVPSFILAPAGIFVFAYAFSGGSE